LVSRGRGFAGCPAKCGGLYKGKRDQNRTAEVDTEKKKGGVKKNSQEEVRKLTESTQLF